MEHLRSSLTLVFVGVFISGIHALSYRECEVNLKKDIPSMRQPLYFKRDPKGQLILAIPGDGHLSFMSDEPMTFACIGKKNFLTVVDGNRQVFNSSCNYQQVFNIIGTAYHSSDITCENNVQAEVQESNENCDFRAKFYNIGYQVQDNWFTIIQVCYNKKDASASYSVHSLYGTGIADAQPMGRRPSFRTDGTRSNISIATAYRIKSQKRHFSTLFQSGVRADEIIRKKSFLTRGHLAPVADFPLVAWKLATFFYLNVAPQWLAVNGGNWRSLETKIRAMAAERRRDFTVFTGTAGVLKLRDTNQVPVGMYLGPRKTIPVPDLLWKIVQDKDSMHAIGFVALNNPFVDTSYRLDVCRDICWKTGFGHEDWEKPSRGLLLCCEVEDMHNVIESLPRLDVRGLLTDRAFE